MSAAAAKDATAEDGPGPSVIAASDIEVDREALDASIREFAGENGDYYVDKFHRIFEKTSPLPNTFNQAAALAGPAWAATRGVWAMFWAFLILEIIAWVQIGRGLWGNPGAEFSDRAETQLGRAQEFLDRAAAAREAGEDPSRFETLAGNLTRAAENSQAQATALGAEATTILLTGLGLLILFKLTQGLWANAAYEKQYSRWRIDASSVPSGFEKRRMWIGLALIGAIAPLTIYKFTVALILFKLTQGLWANAAYEKQYSRWRIDASSVPSGFEKRRMWIGLALIGAIAPLTIYKFTVASPIEALNAFPEAALSGLFLATEGETLYSVFAGWLEARIDAAAIAGAGAFDSITTAVRSVLDALTLALNGTPWPVVMTVICVVAFRSAGPRVAIFTAAALAYIAFLGYWEIAMETVALVGAAVLICIVIGIPLGIWFGKSRRAYNF
ncbi:MAG: hypothetical protein AAFP23_10885, partial [Pseudomonadota bacterium]